MSAVAILTRILVKNAQERPGLLRRIEDSIHDTIQESPALSAINKSDFLNSGADALQRTFVNFPRKAVRELQHPRGWEESPEGLGAAYAYGLIRGAPSLAAPPVNRWSTLGPTAQLAGIAHGAPLTPGRTLSGGAVALATILARNAARRQEPDAAWGQNVNPNPDRDFQRQLEQQQRGR